MSLGLSRITGRLSQPGEIVGLLMPNAAPAMGLILALSIGRRVPALLNYTAGADGMRSACVAAGIKTVIASRGFIEKARLTATVAQLAEAEARGGGQRHPQADL